MANVIMKVNVSCDVVQDTSKKGNDYTRLDINIGGETFKRVLLSSTEVRLLKALANQK